MHILLTDVLTCPRCGPEFGLILLADRVESRRVLQGRLGCPNCRGMYPVSNGEADLRAAGVTADVPASSAETAADAGADPGEGAMRLAALLGLADVKGTVLVAGPGAELAGGISGLLPDIEVVAFRAAPAGGEEGAGVSRAAGGPALPFRARSLRGVALTGGADAALLAEAVRVLLPGARIVVEPAGAPEAETLRGLGAAVMLEQEGVVVARALGEPVRLGVNAVR